MRTAPGKAISRQLSAISLLLVLFVVIFFTITTSAQAADFSWNAQSQSTYTLGNLFNSGIFGLSGVCTKEGGSVEVYEGGKSKIKKCDQDLKIVSGGAIGITTGVLASLYNPPTSSVYYLANLGESLGIGPNTAYAQVGGSGQGIIAPVFKLWQISRNLAYLIFIVVFVVVGFMIMFRQKLNPQTIIGVQQALPGLIIGLILVTFSYFIASLIVDFAFVGIQLVTYIFTQPGLPNSLGNADQIKGHAQNANIFWLYMASAFNLDNIKSLWQGTSGQLSSFTGGPTISLIVGIVVGTISSFFLTPLGGAFVGAGVVLAIPIIIPAIVVLVLLIALFIQMFKILFALISAYITILIMTLAGPFFILVGAIPGKSGAVSSWIKNLLANVLIFPAVFAAFLFAGFILGQPTWNNNTLPLFGGVDGNFIRVLIAYGILLGIPGIPPAIKGALGVKDQNPFVQAAMGGAMGGFGAGKAGFNTATGGLQAERKTYADAAIKARVMAGTPGAPPPPPQPRSYEFWKWGVRRT